MLVFAMLIVAGDLHPPPAQPGIDWPELEVAALWLNDLQYGAKDVRGRLRNNSEVTYEQIEVTVTLADATADSVGTATLQLAELGPREEKWFETRQVPSTVSDLRIATIRGVVRGRDPTLQDPASGPWWAKASSRHTNLSSVSPPE